MFSIRRLFSDVIPRRPLIRDLEAEDLFEAFLVSAVASVLGIRAYLTLTGFPQIGSGGVHVAHVLWGGMFMLVALILLLGFLNRPVKRLAAVVGGLGFGAFIDELGKFLTSDNNYFFQPTVAFIYVLFIALYFATRYLVRRQPVRREEAIMNSLELVKEAIENDLDPDEQRRAANLIKPFVGQDETAARLHKVVRELDTVPKPPPGPLALLRRKFVSGYSALVRQSWFPAALIGFFIVQSFSALLSVGFRLVEAHRAAAIVSLRMTDWGELIGTTASAVLIILGIVQLRRSRRSGYEFFGRALLVSIFLTRVFLFSSEQVSAVLGLGFDIFLLVAVRTLTLLDQADKAGFDQG